MRIKSIHLGNAFITLLLSYLAVFLLPLALGSILYTKTNTIMTDNANRANLAMLEQLRQVLDSKLKDVEQMSQQIALNPRLQWLMNNTDNTDTADAYKFVEFVSDHMSRYQNVSDLISGYYVYFGANDTVLMPTSKTTADVLYQRLYRPVGTSFEAWRGGLLGGPHYKDYTPATYETPTGTLDTITYIQTLPLGEPNDIRGALVILLDVGQVRSMLSKIESAYQSSVYIFDRKDRLIVGNERQALPWNQISQEVTTKGVPYEYKDHGEEMMLSYTVSEQNGWKYVHTMPKHVYLERVQTLKNWMITLLLICLAGGGAAITFWVHRNYAPLRGVVRALQSEKPARAKQPSNEYEFIRETIRMTIHEERELRNILSRQTPVIQASFLSRFVRGHVDVARMTEESLQFMDIRLISDVFAVMLIDIADFSRFSTDQSERQWALIRFIISNIGNELIRERGWGYSVELDQHRVALLVNFDRERRAEAEKELDVIAARLKELIEQRFKTYITLAIGDVHEGMDHACESYFEALSALDYKMYRGHSSIIRYREIAEADRHYYYPIETEIQLINFTKSGDVDNVDKLIGNLFHAHFSQRRITPELGRSLFTNMVSTLWKIINPMDPLYREVFGEKFDPLKELSSCPTVEEMKVQIRDWFLALCHYLNASRSGHSRQLSERIAQYIEQHYGDDSLSLTTIAEHFQLTPQYLSAFFKKQTGMNLTDYLTRVRIDEAKKLMQNKKLTFAQIANQVGYANDIGFIRVFKKYEGTTPGKYRESL
ncbi:HTH-type transcriptional regulator YesS [Paenibacillus konkukensis]|uniref:HTH-type transcriptional regulator YesS n=2 Tax=Paenibacillus konkukensis TaxID=2020716 RepID=A0ABY4RKR5_9BACL|nr:HTH-type transcriptional regulator YesS [Paenibacillus konkukensis]